MDDPAVRGWRTLGRSLILAGGNNLEMAKWARKKSWSHSQSVRDH